MAKQQRLILIISLEKDGRVAINTEFHPKIAVGKEAEKLPPYMRHFQEIVTSIAKGVRLSLQANILEEEQKPTEATDGTVSEKTDSN